MITFLLLVGTLLVLVGVHEGGHFLVAKLTGVYVKEFAIGFGPKLASLRIGETLYSIRAIPFGGYVRMAGEDREETDPEIPISRLFYNRPPFVRILISLAGPAANLLMTFLVLVFALWMFGVPLVQVAALIPGKPAEVMLLPGDRIISIAGIPTYTIEDLDRAVQGCEGAPIEVLVERDGNRRGFVMTPEFEEEEGRYLIGIYPGPITFTNTLTVLDVSSALLISGLRAGDTIVSVGGAPTGTGIDLLLRMNEHLPADSVEVSILRMGVEETRSIQTGGLDLDQVFAGITFADLEIGRASCRERV